MTEEGEARSEQMQNCNHAHVRMGGAHNDGQNITRPYVCLKCGETGRVIMRESRPSDHPPRPPGPTR